MSIADHRGAQRIVPAFLSYGFRPFFLMAGLWSAAALLLWIVIFVAGDSLPSRFDPLSWHIHEMLFGFVMATIAGFLLTAIPNWTGRPPVSGAPLALLAALWLLGRICCLVSGFLPAWLAAAGDLAFPVLLVGVVGGEIVAGRNWRNLMVVMLVVILLAGNIAFHVEAHVSGQADTSIRVGIAVVVFLISLIGGRIIPSFTRNWLVRENPGRLPVPFGRFDMIIVMAGALALCAWVVAPDHELTGVVLALAGLLHLVRLSRWAGDRTFRERLLVILHVGYVFVPLGFLLNAAAAFGWVPPSAGIHAWMAGGAGVMTLAVMTRASLGHTGRPLTASPATQAIYAAIIVAAVARICAVIHPAYGEALLLIAALGWVIAFFGFALVYGPLLLGSTPRGKAVDPAAKARA